MGVTAYPALQLEALKGAIGCANDVCVPTLILKLEERIVAHVEANAGVIAFARQVGGSAADISGDDENRAERELHGESVVGRLLHRSVQRWRWKVRQAIYRCACPGGRLLAGGEGKSLMMGFELEQVSTVEMEEGGWRMRKTEPEWIDTMVLYIDSRGRARRARAIRPGLACWFHGAWFDCFDPASGPSFQEPLQGTISASLYLQEAILCDWP